MYSQPWSIINLCYHITYVNHNHSPHLNHVIAHTYTYVELYLCSTQSFTNKYLINLLFFNSHILMQKRICMSGKSHNVIGL